MWDRLYPRRTVAPCLWLPAATQEGATQQQATSQRVIHSMHASPRPPDFVRGGHKRVPSAKCVTAHMFLCAASIVCCISGTSVQRWLGTVPCGWQRCKRLRTKGGSRAFSYIHSSYQPRQYQVAPHAAGCRWLGWLQSFPCHPRRPTAEAFPLCRCIFIARSFETDRPACSPGQRWSALRGAAALPGSPALPWLACLGRGSWAVGRDLARAPVRPLRLTPPLLCANSLVLVAS